MTFSWNPDDLDLHISRMLDLIVNLANEDNIVTVDEEVMIEALRQKLWQLKPKFDEIVQHSNSIDEAREQIKILFKNVLNEMADTATADKKVSADELKMLDKLAKYIRENDFSQIIQ